MVIQEVNITTELTFGEGSNGQAIVQGQFVGEGEDRARGAGIGASKITGGITSQEMSERAGSSSSSDHGQISLRLIVFRGNDLWEFDLRTGTTC